MSISLMVFDTPGLVGVSYSSLVLADEPIYYYRMNTPNGLEPSIGSNSASLTYSATGITRNVSGLLSNNSDTAASFNGSIGAKATFTHILSGKLDITIECIAKANATNINGCFIKVSDNSTGIGLGIGGSSFDDPGNNLIGVAEGVSWLVPNKTLGTDRNHLVLTANGSTNIVAFFVNGVQVFQRNVDWRGVSNSTCSIGGYGGSGVNRYANAILDEVAIYSKILPTARIKAHADSM